MDTLQEMTDNLSLVKEKIIKTDEVLKLLGNKSKDLNKVEKKYSKLLEKYAEKNHEIELWKEQCKSIEDRLSICNTTHLPLQNDLTILKTRYESLEQNHNVYVNAAEIKYQNSCQEVQKLGKNVEKLTKKIEHLETKGTQQPRNVQKLKTELNLANDKLKKSVLKYEELIADNNKTIAELEEQYKSLEKQRNADLIHLAQIQVECDELKKSIQSKCSSKEDAKPAALQVQIENFQRELKSSTDELTTLKYAHEKDIKEITIKYTLENELLKDKLAQLKPEKIVTNSTTQTELDDFYNFAEILTEMTTIPNIVSPLTPSSIQTDITIDELITDDVAIPESDRIYFSIASGPNTIIPMFKESSTQTPIENCRQEILKEYSQSGVFKINENTEPKPTKERTKCKTNKVIKNYKNAINKMLKNVKNNLNTKKILDNVLSTSSPLVIVSPRILKSYLNKIGVSKSSYHKNQSPSCSKIIKPCCTQFGEDHYCQRKDCCLSSNNHSKSSSLSNYQDEIKSHLCNNHDSDNQSAFVCNNQREFSHLDMKFSCNNHGPKIGSDFHNKINSSLCDNHNKISFPSRNIHFNGFCSIHNNHNKINCSSYDNHSCINCPTYDNNSKINCSSYNNHKCSLCGVLACSYNKHCKDFSASCDNDSDVKCVYNCEQELVDSKHDSYDKINSSACNNHNKESYSSYDIHNNDLSLAHDYYSKINSSLSNNQCCASVKRCKKLKTVKSSNNHESESEPELPPYLPSIKNRIAFAGKCYSNSHVSRLKECKINKPEQKRETYRLNMLKNEYKKKLKLKKYRRIIYSSDEEESRKSYTEQRNTNSTENKEIAETNLALATENSTEVNVLLAKYLNSLPLDQNTTRKAVSDTDSGIDTLSIKTVKSPISIDINNIENYKLELSTLNIENQNETSNKNSGEFEDSGIHFSFNEMQTSKNAKLNSNKHINHVSTDISEGLGINVSLNEIQNSKVMKTKKYANKKLYNFMLKTNNLQPVSKTLESETVKGDPTKKPESESGKKQQNKTTNSISESSITDESINKNYLELDSKSECKLQEKQTMNSKLELSVNDEFINKNVLETYTNTEIKKVSSKTSEISIDAVLLKSQQVKTRKSKSESSAIDHSQNKDSLEIVTKIKGESTKISTKTSLPECSKMEKNITRNCTSNIDDSLNENALETKTANTIKISHEPELTKLQQNSINTETDFLNLNVTKKRKKTSENDSDYKKKKIDIFGSDVESDSNSSAADIETYRFLETPKKRVAHKPILKAKVATKKNVAHENTDEFIQNKKITELVKNRKLAIDKLLPNAKTILENVEPKTKEVFKRPGNFIQHPVVQPCPKSPDFVPYSIEKPKNIPLKKEKVEELDLKIGRKLVADIATLNWNNDLMATVVNCLSKQDSGYVAKLIVNQAAKDYSQEFDRAFTPPAPLMTVTQQKLLVLMTQLEKNGLQTIQQSFLHLAEKRLLSENKVEAVHPLTRLYVAVCKLKYDIEQVRMLCCNAAYHMGDLLLPLMFIILTMWGDVLPMAQQSEEIYLATALVQIIQSKTCKKPGYNFMNLNNLLKDYYGYKRGQISIDDVIAKLISAYTENCSNLVYISILILCKNQPSKWTYKQITTHFIPIITNNMQIEAKSNLVSMTFVLLSRLVDSFDAKPDKDCIKGIHDWLCQFIQENAAASTKFRKSIETCLSVFFRLFNT